MTQMKAVRYYPPGGPEKLQFVMENVPRPGPGQLLIKVHAVSLVAQELTWDIWKDEKGAWIARIPGHDFAGTVVECGPGVERGGMQNGNEVYGFTGFTDKRLEGAMAEFTVVSLDMAVPKPRNLTFEQAAAVPLSALTSWQALHTHGQLQCGQRVLITGGGGGSGLFAVQFARSIGAHITATASSERSFSLLKEWGADEIVNYKNASLAEAIAPVDLVLDCIGGETFKQCLPVVGNGGKIVSIVEYEAEKLAKEAEVYGEFFIVRVDAPGLTQITKMLEDGSLKVVVDATFPLEKTQEAWMEALKGHTHGKNVLTVG